MRVEAFKIPPRVRAKRESPRNWERKVEQWEEKNEKTNQCEYRW